MATRALNLTRSILTTKQTLSLALSRSYTSLSLSTPPPFSTFSLFRLRPLFAAAASLSHASPSAASLRGFATRQTTSSLNDSSPNWSNRPPKETILLDGCDFEHWLVVMEKPEGDPTRDDIIDSYIKTLAQVVGSEDEARMKIYSVSTKHYFAFGALVSEEVSFKIKELPKVRWVLPDSYLDVRNKDYGGEPFINGQAVPYDPKYHEEWVRNNARANERNRRNDRPRNFDRSRNFERRRENMQQNRGPNTGGPPPSIGGGPPNMGGGPPPQGNMGGGPPPQGNMGGGMPPQGNMGGGMPPQGNMGGGMPPPGNMGGGMPPQGNMGGGMPPPGNMGGGMPPQGNMGGGMPPPSNMSGPPRPNNYGGGPPPNYGGGGPPPNYGGGGPPPNYGGGPPPNYGGGPPPNYGGGPPNPSSMQHGGPPPPPNYGNMGGGPNNAPNFQQRGGPNDGGMPYQQSPGYQNAPPPNMAGGNPYQTQNMPGRDNY